MREKEIIRRVKRRKERREERKKEICSSCDAKAVTKAAASRSRQREVMRVRDERGGKREENTEQSLCVRERERRVSEGVPPSLAQ